MRRQVLPFTLSLVVLTACGGGSGQGRPSPGRYCAVIQTVGSSLSSVQLSITAMDTKFDAGCLVAPAGVPFTIRFDNEDSNTHNVDILDHGRSLFDGPVTIGPKVTTYSVQALPAGAYAFRCDVHPLQMRGTFLVRG